VPTQFDGRELTNREFFIRSWEYESPAFRGVLKALPSEKLAYRPHPNSRSAGELAAVLVSFVKGCADVCSTQQSSYNTSMRWHPDDRAATLEEMLAAYDAHHKELAVQLNKIDDHTWNHAAWVVRGEQEILLKGYRRGIVVAGFVRWRAPSRSTQHLHSSDGR